MKISAIELKEFKDGLSPFQMSFLGDIVILAGRNGSGKTRLLKLIEQQIRNLRRKGKREDSFLDLWIKKPGEEERYLDKECISEITLINYSHFDAQLQQSKDFPIYVVCKARELLKTCSYEETALNAYLLLDDMAHGYSEEFRDGKEFEHFVTEFAKPFHIDISKDEENRLCLFGQTMEHAALSPGQLYLLRIAVACYCNRDNPNLVFLMDEPELHLHPQAQIELIKMLRSKFKTAQFWISSHSLTLISYLTTAEKQATLLYLQEGKVHRFRSDSSSLLEGLIGSNENLFAIQQLLAMPDEYACNRFAAECTDPPDVVGASGGDPQTEILETVFRENEVIIDFGAGKGRFLEELSLVSDIMNKLRYYAYDRERTYAQECRMVMKHCGILPQYYFNDIKLLLQEAEGQADYVLLINVLHEIPPRDWRGVFETIYRLLKDEGHLLIVEREELMVGEAPYDNGFLMMMKEGAAELFDKGSWSCEAHWNKPYIVRYMVKKAGLKISDERVRRCVERIKEGAFGKIEEVKYSPPVEDGLSRFRRGIRLAFYLHQYANASLILKDLEGQSVIQE